MSLPQSGVLLLPLAAAAVALWWMLPRFQKRRSLPGGLLGLVALAALGVLWLHPSGQWMHDLPFYLLSAAAVGSAALMITDRDPVHSALWFAVTTLSVCGLFLLRSAAFLAAATAIVYAGAIIVIFLFVIMLARQTGQSRYDQQASQPLPATLLAMVLLGGIFFSLETWRTGEALADRPAGGAAGGVSRQRLLSPPERLAANALSEPTGDAEFGTMRGLGRSLFGDYLFAVEVAGTLLVVAAVGAIAIAPRTRRGTL